MRRREFISLIGSVAATWPVAARAQQSTIKIPRIGWVVIGSPTSHRFSLAAFRDGLKALGYVEGQNIEVAYRFGNFDRAVVPALAEGLLRLNPHVIFAADPIAVLVVKSAAPATPIVCALLIDPIKAGLARSLARPSGRWIDGKAGRIGSGVNATRHHGRLLGRSSEPNPCGSAP